nr:tetratricopeptide repeat protein [uncultured Sphaerochaeta sp.]
MENYFARLLLSSELDDPLYFARVHQNIADLEKKRVAHFNEYGPMNQEYVLLMGDLNMAYYRAGETHKELEVAQQIYQTSQILHGDDNESTIEAMIALGNSYLDDGQSAEAQSIVVDLLNRDYTKENGPSYDLYIDSLCLQADIYHIQKKFDEELLLRQQVLTILTSFQGSTSSQSIMARCALGVCLERRYAWREALEQYRIIRSYLDIESDFASEAEKIGLLVHIARCYRKLGEVEDARTLYRWAHRKAHVYFGPASPLALKMQRLLKAAEHNNR